eukprot:Skav204518  [mRNA]  locus=scaffold3201:294789:295898:+ [translate_table: standard]
MAGVPPPIDLSGDEDELDDGHGVVETSHALVPVSSGSPTKRPKTRAVALEPRMDHGELVSLIQTTIQNSISTSLGDMQATVQTLADRTQTLADETKTLAAKASSHDTRLDRVEGIVCTSQSALKQHSSRIDSMHDELIALQQHLGSPKASPPPSAFASPTHGAQQGEPSFDIVLGGWKDGVTKEWVEVQIGKLLESTHVKDHVPHIKTFGKRPGFAKLELKYDEGLNLIQRRELQGQLVGKLREAAWTPHDRVVWIVADKTPSQRKVSRAVAILSTFLSEKLAVDRGMLEVASWPAAKAYVGEWRVTGLSEDHAYGARPQCEVADLRWLIQDERTAVNVWVDLANLAKGLGVDKVRVSELWQAHFGSRT